MKSRYKRPAWLLDEDILLTGYVDKRGFHVEHGIPCGFSLQKLNKKDRNKIVFFDTETAIKKLGNISIAGGKILVAIDDGMAATKAYVTIKNDKKSKAYLSYTPLKEDEDIKDVAKKILKEVGIYEVCHCEMVVGVSSNELKPMTYKID